MVFASKLYIRKEKEQSGFIEIGHTVNTYLFPSNDQEN